MKINYHRTSELWLSLEAFYNAGYTPEQLKRVIEATPDIGGYGLRCEPAALNENWIVKTYSNDPGFHRMLVDHIAQAILDLQPEQPPAGGRDPHTRMAEADA